VADDAAGVRVELTIPAQPAYVSVARLAILGIASRMPFTYDEVEDIRLAVGEACTHAIARVQAADGAHPNVRIVCTVEPRRLQIEVIDDAPATEAPEAAPEASPFDEAQLGGVLIRILMDEVEQRTDPETGAHVLRMVKHLLR